MNFHFNDIVFISTVSVSVSVSSKGKSGTDADPCKTGAFLCHRLSLFCGCSFSVKIL
jgi:hypothetical protein